MKNNTKFKSREIVFVLLYNNNNDNNNNNNNSNNNNLGFSFVNCYFSNQE